MKSVHFHQYVVAAQRGELQLSITLKQAQVANWPMTREFGDYTTSYYFFYMWRFGWVFYLIALFFEVLAFFAGFVALCGRLGSAIAGLVSLTAFFFLSIAVSLMT
jgi:hypothetical protein